MAKKLVVLSFILVVFGVLPLATNAAILYLEPSAGEYHQGDTFIIEVKIDTQGEYINTIQADLTFSSEILKVQDISEGNSIINLWIKKPEIAEDSPPLDLISFSGGIPGGYQGKDGLLLKIVFQTKEIGGGWSSAEVDFLDSCQVLLNDGLGTPTKLTSKEAVFSILPEKLEISKNEWQEEISKDKTSPQPFKIEISRDLSIFDGKYFIVFSTTDKETGVDHYEVKEGKRDWKMAVSPYVLENQKLTSDIKVKAIDKAGNFWLETLEAPNKPEKGEGFYVILVLVLIFVIIILIRIFKRILAKTQ